MTEFITRSCQAESRYEVIIKTDNINHACAAERFARRLIDHAKPVTNGDRMRYMSNEKLAKEFAKRLMDQLCITMVERGIVIGSVQLAAMQECYAKQFFRRLESAEEGEDG